MSARRSFNSIVAKAEKEAFRLVRLEVSAVLPKGWRLHLAVGWGLTLYDDKGKALVGTYKDVPDRLPKGVRKACLLAADFVEIFGYDNSVIDGVAS